MANMTASNHVNMNNLSGSLYHRRALYHASLYNQLALINCKRYTACSKRSGYDTVNQQGSAMHLLIFPCLLQREKLVTLPACCFELNRVLGMEDPAQEDAGLKASREAVAFLASIEWKELQDCLFADTLVTVSDTGRELGEFSITVQKANYDSQPCFHVHASSHGSIDDIPCGTSITAYISKNLETLEQNHHEYVKLQDYRLDRKSQMVRRGEQLLVNKVVTEREEVKRQILTFPLTSLEGFVSEASNLVILRILAQRKKIPENMVFLSLDNEMHISVSTYQGLGLKKQMVGQESLEVLGIERTVEAIEDVPTKWHCYFLSDGHLVSRVQVGSPVTMRLVQLPAQMGEDDKADKVVFEKKPLVWEEDMQLCSKFLDRKEELKADHASYVRQHPELKALLADFLQFLLLRKPDDVFLFAAEYFAPFSSQRTLGSTLKSSSIIKMSEN